MLDYQILLLIFIIGTVGICIIYLEFKRKNVDIWFLSWLKGCKKSKKDRLTHLLFCYVDHYEPQWGRPDRAQEDQRVDRWCLEYPKLVEKHRDADGNHPIHSFFYPEEEYRKEHLDKLSSLCGQGLGEIEIHLHHDDDTEEGLRQKLDSFMKILHHDHGALSIDPATGSPCFAFIHGDWALDNSRYDGRMCGINNELIVLREMGCYADFTLPSAPSETQTKQINSIYYAADEPNLPKSHNTGIEVEVGVEPSGDLMLIQGPLTFNGYSRKWGLIPRIENGDIRRSMPPTTHRVDLWVNCGIHVKGRPEWVFVKIHTHGTQETDMPTLLGQESDEMFSYLESKYNDGSNYALHYVSAREMYNIAKAAEAGESGNPNEYRNYILPRPKNLGS